MYLVRELLRAGCIAIAIVAAPVANAQRAEPGGKSGGSVDEEVVLREAEKIERAVVNLVNRVQRSTVSVLNYQLVEPAPGQPKVERIVGVGSGFIVGTDGRIFTNVHVVANHSRLEVVLHDGRVLPAIEHAEVSKYDFALLLCRIDGLAAAEWAKTTLVQPGQLAIAAGNPRALAMRGKPVVTFGIVSGLGRTAIDPTYPYGNAVQTDAEINPGNSGGPLFDSNGRIIGINGKISTTNAHATNVGVGFTIPAQQVKNFLPALNAGGAIEPGYSGITVGTPENGADGVLVSGVAPSSPAAKAGLKAGDRIVALNGSKIDSLTTWINDVSMLPGGWDMSVSFYRKDKLSVKRFDLEARSNPLPKR